MRNRLRSVLILSAILLAVGIVAEPAFGAAVDDLGTKAVSTKGESVGWPGLVGKAHKRAPAMKIFWPHPTKQAEGFNYAGIFRNDGGEGELQGPDAESYRCASSVTSFLMGYHTKKYAEDPFSDPNNFNILVENSTPRPCEWEFDRSGFGSGYQAGIFTATGTATIHLRKGVRKGGKLKVERYTAGAKIYTDTGGTGVLAGLDDCLLVMNLGGTSVSVLADGGPGGTGPNCAKAEEMAGRLDRIRYAKK